MKTISWLNEAWDELQEIRNYVLTEHGSRSAERVQEDIFARIDSLESMPELGTLDTELHYHGKPVRILHSKHTRIIYAVHETEVVIIMLWNNLRDDSMLKKIISQR